MAEEEDLLEDDDEEEGFEPSAGTSGKSRIITILLWVAGAIFAVILMVLISYLMARKVKTEAYKEGQNIVIAPAPPPWATYRFQKEIRVNTADVDEPHYIQASIAFGYDGDNKALTAELSLREVQLRHIVIMILSGKKKEDLATVIQKNNLQDEIKSLINNTLTEGKIDEVFFEELVLS